jgi:UDP-GlcNAc3NAcA epimerase
MLQVATIVGARPQFIKAAIMSRAYVDSKLQETIIHTGQHFDFSMSENFFVELNIPSPKYNLGIGGGTHGSNTGRMLEAIESTLLQIDVDVVVVFGDTDSTLAAALAATKLDIPVAHIEAGLRSFNRQMPEEINRVLTDHVSSLLFTPTESALENLVREGIDSGIVVNSGDVMYDAMEVFGPSFQVSNREVLGWIESSHQYVFFTAHRPQNVDIEANLVSIISALGKFELPVIFPVHPRTRKRIAELNLVVPGNVLMLPAIGYFETQALLRGARLVITDSGGLQKEAFFHQTPSLVLRNESEWKELEILGVSRLVGANAELILEGLDWAKEVTFPTTNTFGTGQSRRIVTENLVSRFQR